MTPSQPSPAAPAPVPKPQGPTLTGVVFQTTEEGRLPVSGAHGRQSLSAVAGCAGAVTQFPGFRFTNVPVEINGDTVLDVDITSSISSCPQPTS